MSLQVLGESTKPGIDRPTAYGHVSYTPETAPWFRLISLHYASACTTHSSAFGTRVQEHFRTEFAERSACRRGNAGVSDI